MVVSETIGYVTIFALTIVFTAFSFVIQDNIWRILLKAIAGLFWMIFGIVLFVSVGTSGFLSVMSLPFVIIGLIFWIILIYDFFAEKKEKPFRFED